MRDGMCLGKKICKEEGTKGKAMAPCLR